MWTQRESSVFLKLVGNKSIDLQQYFIPQSSVYIHTRIHSWQFQIKSFCCLYSCLRSWSMKSIVKSGPLGICSCVIMTDVLNLLSQQWNMACHVLPMSQVMNSVCWIKTRLTWLTVKWGELWTNLIFRWSHLSDPLLCYLCFSCYSLYSVIW